MEETKYAIIKYYSAEIKIKIKGNESESELKTKIFETIGIYPPFQKLTYSNDEEYEEYEEYDEDEIPIRNGTKIYLKEEGDLELETEFGFKFGLKIRQTETIREMQERIEEKYNIPKNEQNWFFSDANLNKTYLSLFEYNKIIEGIIDMDSISPILIKISNKKKMDLNILNGENIIELSIEKFNTIKNLYKLLEQKMGKEIKIEEQALLFDNKYLSNSNNMLINYDFNKNNNILKLEKPPFFSYAKLLNGKTLIIFCHPSDKIIDFKKNILDEGGPEIDDQRLVCLGKQLEDNKTLSDYNIKKGSILYLVLRLR